MAKSNETLLTDDEKRQLLSLARQTIKASCAGEALPVPQHPSASLQTKSGAFVTLHKHGLLRGCIGYVQAIKPLAEAIVDMAEAASQRDPRFTPVSPEEVPALEIEISVLSPLRPVDSVNDIIVGHHGLMIEQGPYTGLLLPQVAEEQGWDLETFLQQTCRKAGLPANAWRDSQTVIYYFFADIFSEIDMKTGSDSTSPAS
jgi:AmmeMemoRadiSam system protein A